MVVSFVATSRLATESGTEFQKQLDQIEAIPPLELDRTRQDLAGLKGDITVMKGDITGIKNDVNTIKGVQERLLNDIKTSNDEIHELSASLRGSFATVNHKLDNARKRLLNAGISALDTPLHILVNVNTGEAIHGFPPSVAAVVEVQASGSGRC